MSNEFSINILRGKIDSYFFSATCDKLVDKWVKDHGQNPDKGIKAGAAVYFQCFYSVEYVLLRCDALPGSDHVLY